jgi:hypothetical protein
MEEIYKAVKDKSFEFRSGNILERMEHGDKPPI